MAATINQQGKKLQQHLLINKEWNYNNNCWSTGNEVRATPIDKQGMKSEQQLLTNREWS